MNKLSIVICSRTKDITSEFRNNIAETIGCEYQLIVIDNSMLNYNIFSAYNEGACRSDGDIICFVHDDVKFHTQNWGELIIAHFSDKTVGIVGIAGTHFLPVTPCAWWEPDIFSQNLIQTYDGSGKKVHEKCNRFFADDAVALDGVFLCIPHRLFEVIKWDAETFQGFHGYDVDICLQILSAGYRVIVAQDILLEHNSRGSYSEDFVKAQQKVFDKWKHILPIVRGVELSDEEIKIRTQMISAVHTGYSNGYQYASRKYRYSNEFKLGNALLHPWTIIRHRLGF